MSKKELFSFHFLSERVKDILDMDVDRWSILEEMMPPGRHNESVGDIPAQQAAVCILLFEENEQWHTLFIRRTSRSHDKHSGQLAFPGGRQESNETLEQCALRECEEEIGLQQDQMRIMGRMDALYIPVSNFDIHPFLVYLNTPISFKLQEDEVAEIIKVPLDYFLMDNRKRYMNISSYKNVPFYDLYGHTLWGATAMLWHEFITRWKLRL